MDLSQRKLSKSEWETIEVPVSHNEKQILKLIISGYHDVNIRTNEHLSLYSFLKIDKSPETELLLFNKYFEDTIKQSLNKYGKDTPLANITFQSIGGGELKNMKSLDRFRIQNMDTTLGDNKSLVFEFLLMDLATELVKQIYKKKQKYAFYLYTLMQLKKTSITNLNGYLMKIIDDILAYANSFTKTSEIITNAYEFIERNSYLLKYEDRSLFAHQKQLFSICKPCAEGAKFVPKLILYTAPTGTGKTLSPIGLSENYRIIFVCVARHIGLALAKSAISMEKKVAFAFGCESAADVRLHYFSAVDYTRNKRSGGIGKVDNSVGTNVEIMICDVQSYITAMHYMLAFNSAERIITYWDEPTITLDYQQHDLHSVIHNNWTNNKIPTMILSCATLPTSDELQPVFADFRCKFEDADIRTITSYDCRKSIPIIDKSGYCVLPHFMYPEFTQLYKCIQHCDQNKTLLRYFDLREIIRFVEYINSENLIDEAYTIDSYFTDNISNITMNKLKEYYLDVLLHINPENWTKIYKYVTSTRKKKYADAKPTGLKKSTSVEQSVRSGGGALQRTTSVFVPPTTATPAPASSGILLTTSDAYTLTDGPTIFLAEDVNKIGNFYIQQTDIAPSVFQNILSKITKNTEIIARIDKLESDILAKETKTNSDTNSNTNNAAARESGRLCKESQAWMTEINKLRKEIRSVGLDPMYVPNTRPHQAIWTPDGEIHEEAFVANIDETTVKEIMQLNISNNFKVLLLLGIGMFTDNPNVQYMEIMKKLADEQRLFIIIASSDYIYGTNYQFCHGFIGKDLANITQQKTLQAMGRIGRNNIQQDYTIRFRTDEMIMNLFTKSPVNIEADNMCALFST
jgi:hypothetical protein